MMKTNKRDRMNEQILRHGKDLKAIFGIDEDADKLARRVHSIEVKAHRLSTDYCNGVIDMEKWEAETDKILNRLDKIINFKVQNIPVFVNSDARGYALKIKDDCVREHDLKIHKDWGGYGILAPEFDGTN
jgi:hypothetical protein